MWVGTELDSLAFVGATAESNGKAGFVPAPKAGEQNLFLRADGKWAPAANSVQAFEITIEDGKDHIQAIEEYVADKIVNNGDVAIIKEIYTTSAYLYSEGKWVAITGNYSADNVYFKNDFLFTENIGSITIPESGSVKVPAAGKNLSEFLTSIFTVEASPEITGPSMVLIASENKHQEVGTVISPKYSIEFNPGKYSYGPETGVEITKIEVKDSKGHTSSTLEGIFEDIVVEDGDMNYTITASIEYSEGTTPKNNLGEEYQEGKIKAGNLTATSGSIIGYQPYYCGLNNTEDEITVDLIKSLNNCDQYVSNTELIFDANIISDVKRFIIAIPKSEIGAGIASAVITTSMNADVIDFYKLIEVDNYNVWVYAPAVISHTEIHKVILK